MTYVLFGAIGYFSNQVKFLYMPYFDRETTSHLLKMSVLTVWLIKTHYIVGQYVGQIAFRWPDLGKTSRLLSCLEVKPCYVKIPSILSNSAWVLVIHPQKFEWRVFPIVTMCVTNRQINEIILILQKTLGVRPFDFFLQEYNAAYWYMLITI